MTNQTQQAPTTTAAAEIEGMSLAAVHEGTRPWAELLQGPHPPEVSRVVGALTGVVLDRSVRLMVAYTLRDAGLLAGEVVEQDSWAQLMRLLDEHYPPDVFVGGPDADPGPRIVALVRTLGSFGPSTLCECGHPVVDHDRSPTFCKAALRDLSGPCPCMTFTLAREASRDG